MNEERQTQNSRRNNASSVELGNGRYLINITQGTQPEISSGSLSPLLINLIPTDDGQLKMVPVPKTILDLESPEFGFQRPAGASAVGAILGCTFLRRKITRNSVLGVNTSIRYFFVPTTILTKGGLTCSSFIIGLRSDGTISIYNELNNSIKEFYVVQGFTQQYIDVKYIETVSMWKNDAGKIAPYSFVEIFFCAYIDSPNFSNHNIKYLMKYIKAFTTETDAPVSVSGVDIAVLKWADQPVFTINKSASDPNDSYWTTIGLYRSQNPSYTDAAINNIILPADSSNTVQYSNILYDYYQSATNNANQYSIDFTISISANSTEAVYGVHFFGKNKCFFTSSIPYRLGNGFVGSSGLTPYPFPSIFNNLSIIYEQDPVMDTGNPDPKAKHVIQPGIPLTQEFAASIVNVESSGSSTIIIHFENNFTAMYQLKIKSIQSNNWVNGEIVSLPRLVPSLEIIDQKGMDGVTAFEANSGIELNDKTYIVDDSGNLRVTVNKPFNYSEKLADQIPQSSFFSKYDNFTRSPVDVSPAIPEAVQMSKSFALRYINILGYDVLNIGDYLCATLNNSNLAGSLGYSMFHLQSSEQIDITIQSTGAQNTTWNNQYSAPAKITGYSKKNGGSWDVPCGNLIGVHNKLITFPKKYEDSVAIEDEDIFSKSLLITPVNFFLSNNTTTTLSKIEMQVYLASAIDFVTIGIIVLTDNIYYQDLIDNWSNDDWWRAGKINRIADITTGSVLAKKAPPIFFSKYVNKSDARCSVISFKTSLGMQMQSFALAIRLGGFDNAKTNKMMIEQIVVSTGST